MKPAQPIKSAGPHLDLGHAAGRRGDADQVKLAQQLVVRRHLALALENLDADLRHKGEGAQALAETRP